MLRPLGRGLTENEGHDSKGLLWRLKTWKFLLLNNLFPEFYPRFDHFDAKCYPLSKQTFGLRTFLGYIVFALLINDGKCYWVLIFPNRVEENNSYIKNHFCKQVLLTCRMKCSVAWCLRTARIQCMSNCNVQISKKAWWCSLCVTVIFQAIATGLCWSLLGVTEYEFMLIGLCKYLYWIEPPCSRLSPGQAWVQVKRLWRAILRRDYEMAINRFHIIRLFISKQIVVDRELKSRYKLQANVAKSSSLVDYCLILNRGNRASETEQRKSCFHEKRCVLLPSFELFKL